MPLFYCFNCGFGTEYTLNKPKVCLKCNQSFYQPTVAPQTVSKVTLPKVVSLQVPTQVVDDYSEPEEIPEINPTSFASVEAVRPGTSFTFAKPVTVENKKPTLKRATRKAKGSK